MNAKTEQFVSRIASPPVDTSGRADFERLTAEWRQHTGHFSSITKKVQHPAYRRIVALGKRAIPWLLEELRDRPSYWFAALSEISGENPVSLDSDFAAARQTWLDWGRQRGDIA